MRVFRIIFHVPEEQRADEVGCRKTAGRMAAAGGGGGFDGEDAQLVGNALQQFKVRINHK